jgi:hypothetical protein
VHLRAAQDKILAAEIDEPLVREKRPGKFACLDEQALQVPGMRLRFEPVVEARGRRLPTGPVSAHTENFCISKLNRSACLPSPFAIQIAASSSYSRLIRCSGICEILDRTLLAPISIK